MAKLMRMLGRVEGTLERVASDCAATTAATDCAATTAATDCAA